MVASMNNKDNPGLFISNKVVCCRDLNKSQFPGIADLFIIPF